MMSQQESMSASTSESDFGSSGGVQPPAPPRDSANINNSALALAAAAKDAGNALFRSGDCAGAVAKFSEALALNPLDDKCFCNRSLALSALKDYSASNADARRAISINKSYMKAHFRLIKNYIEMNRLKDARVHLLYAFGHCGEESKEFLPLEKEIEALSGHPVRPKPGHFEVIDELGDGNFTKVSKCKFKPTGRVYAVKTIEKQTAERMKRRHPNIHNEILMEKRVLTKLSHKNIIELYATFQDFGTLYYMMEFVEGGDLWSRLQYVLPLGPSAGGGGGTAKYPIGLDYSFARFVATEALNGIEYLHQRGIVHRDLKPENMMIAGDGHVKIVDFGTAKDLLVTDLNGPEFVGTPEYMPPSVVKSRNTGPEGDLWSLGIVIYQLFLGFTPFWAPSPYLSFLKIKRCNLKIPSFLPEEAAQLITCLLNKDPYQRLSWALGKEVKRSDSLGETQAAATDDVSANDDEPPLDTMEKDKKFFADQMQPDALTPKIKRAPTNLKNCVLTTYHGDKINYNPIRNMPFFTKYLAGTDTVYKNVSSSPPEVGLGPSSRPPSCESPRDFALNRHMFPAARVPLLSELCIKVVAKTAVVVAETMSLTGTPRPAWFDLSKLPNNIRARIAFYLDRCARLHSPGVYRLFWSSIVDSRCNRVDPAFREYIGYSRTLQGHWKDNFSYAMISNPTLTSVGTLALNSATGSFGNASTDNSESSLRNAVSTINKSRPRFVIVTGNFVSLSLEGGGGTGGAGGGDASEEGPQRLVDRRIDCFRKCMTKVSDTIPVLFVPGTSDISSWSVEHGRFLPSFEGIQNYRLRFGCDFYGFWYGGLRVLVLNTTLFAYHTCTAENKDLHDIFLQQEIWLEEELENAKLSAAQVTLVGYHPWFLVDKEEEDNLSNIPKVIRLKWLNKLRHSKVPILFCSNVTESSSIGGLCFPKKGRSKRSSDRVVSNAAAAAEVASGSGGDADSQFTVPMKPSEIIARAKELGELNENNSSSEDDEDNDEKVGSGGGASGGEDDENMTDAAAKWMSAKEKEKAEKAEKRGDDSGSDDEHDTYLNIENDFDGPDIVGNTFSLSSSSNSSNSSNSGSGSGSGSSEEVGIRVINVSEHAIEHRFYSLTSFPKSLH